MALFSKEEIADFLLKQKNNLEQFDALMLKVLNRAKKAGQFYDNMAFDPVLAFLRKWNDPEWGEVISPITSGQLALILMAQAFCQEILEAMLIELPNRK